MNNIILIGRLTKDAEARKTSNDKSVCGFSIAVDRRFKDKDGHKVTDFFKCTAWGNLADCILKYTHKGSLVGVQGELQTEQWEKDGVTHYGTNIQVDQCQFLTSKAEEEAEASKENDITDELEPIDEELPF